MLRIKKQRIIINSTSGISGAGRNLNPEKLFAAGTDNYQAYAIAKHRHYPEMLAQINDINKDIDLLFVPHLSSIDRGIYSTHYITLPNLDLKQLYDIYNEYYQDSEFITILDQTYPKLSQVNKTNNCIALIIEALLFINKIYRIIKSADRIKNVFLKTLMIDKESFIKL